MDHCGNLPNLVRQGFSGPIYCTPATRDLTAVMLGDSARIHEEDAVVASVVHGPTDRPPALYSRSDAARVTSQCVAVPYESPRDIAPDVRLRFVDAGHILGSAMAELTIARPVGVSRITFTGDLGRRGLPFLREPSAVPTADLLICESTYGGRRPRKPGPDGGPHERRGAPHPGPRRQGADPRVQPRPHADRRPLPAVLDARRRPAARAALRR